MPESQIANAAHVSPQDYRWLVSPDAERWLRSAEASRPASTAQVAQLRSHLSGERTHLVLEQVALRERAREKFCAAGEMFFTPRGLEQSTDEVVAAHKARRFSRGSRVFDLCCGIGGDLLALARRGDTLGFDRDEVLAIVAAANMRVLASGNSNCIATVDASEVHARDVETLDLADCSAWHIDPDRRPTGRRTTRVELHEPGPLAIEKMLARNANGAVKLAPAATLPETWWQRAELEWISRGRECRQLVAWFGDFTRDCGRRRATVLGSGNVPARSIVGSSRTAPPTAEKIGPYVFEPDAAVLAAHLEGVLAAEHGLAGIAPNVAYWTGERPIRDPALACFQVFEVLPFRIQTVKNVLRARNIGRLEIKKRNVNLDPDVARRELALKGDEAATLLVAPIAKHVTAILARRVQVF